jgi:hypothetical protein
MDQLIATSASTSFHQFPPVPCRAATTARTPTLNGFGCQGWPSYTCRYICSCQVSRAWLAQIEASSDSDSHGRCPIAMSHGMACDVLRSSPALSVLGGLQDPVPRDARTSPSQSLNETVVAWLAKAIYPTLQETVMKSTSCDTPIHLFNEPSNK